MWDRLKKHPRGRLSLRSLYLLATSVFVAVFVCIAAPHTAFAEDVLRTSDGFSYQGKAYTTKLTVQPGDPRNLTTAAAGPVTAYEYVDTASNKVSDIYFASSVDPATATSALYVTFNYTPPSTYAQTGAPSTLTIGKTVITSASNSSGCNLPGLGWILCPVGDVLSKMVDGFYGIIMTFLDVQPMTAGSPIYDIWNAVRSIANIVFLIVFLIIIFSQVTSAGISTYGVRKALPRLVIAALLVNVSYFICAIAIDLSNLLGHSVYALFKSFTDSLGAATVDVTWSALTGAAFGAGVAGSIVVGHLWFAVATAGSLWAVWFTLLGMLITVGLAALTALLILAARQAILIVFVIVSPIAFVAYVLPGTEKWYKKWQETFVAMLVMFPIFSVVFGGAMLAGAAIIIGANGNIFLVILGKAVQVIPLAITPLIVKFSTGILGTIANLANDRKKGLVDRAKNWTKDQAEYNRKKSLAKDRNLIHSDKSKLLNRIGKTGWRGTAQAFDNIDRRQKKEMEGFEAASEARAFSTLKYRKAYQYSAEQGLNKDTAENNLKAGWDEARRTGVDYRGRTNHKLVASELTNRASQTEAKNQAEKLDRMHAEIVAQGTGSEHISGLNITNAKLLATLQTTAGNIKSTTEEIAFTGIAKKMAERTHQDNIANILRDNETEIVIERDRRGKATRSVKVREYAGGIKGEEGENAALAYAVASQRKQYGEAVNEMNELIKHMNVDTGDLQDMIMGRKTTAVGHYKDSHGVTKNFDFKRSNEYAVEAALENNIAIGTVPMVDEILIESGKALEPYKTTIAASLAKAGHTGRSIYQGGRLISEVGQGKIKDRKDLLAFIQGIIADGKFSAAQLADLDAPAAANFLEAARHDPLASFASPAEYAEFQGKLNAGIARLADKARTATSSGYTQDRVKENTLEILDEMSRL